MSDYPIKYSHFLLNSFLLAMLLGGLGCDDSAQSEPPMEELLADADPLPMDDMGMDQGSTQVSCDQERPPLVLAHGFLASGDTWSRHVRRLIALGMCPDRISPFDWNSLNQSADHTQALDTHIDQILQSTGAQKVDLVGHSAGGGLGYLYLEDQNRASKVRRYVHIASFPNEAPAGPESNRIPTLNLRSLADLTVEGADIPGAENITLNDEDHYGVATSFASFKALYSFLYQEDLSEDPLLNAQEEPVFHLAGRLLTLGENQVIPNATLDIWSLDEQGARVEQQAQLNLSSDGRYESPPLAVGARYELAPLNTSPDAPLVRYFTPALTQDDPLLYLRAFPGPGTLASILVNQLPRDEAQTSLVVFNAHKAFLTGRDSLTLNGQELLSPDVAAAEDTAIALFIFDVNADGEPGGTISLFENFPFLSVIDVPLPSEGEGGITLNFNGQEIVLPRIPSSEATLISVFP